MYVELLKEIKGNVTRLNDTTAVVEITLLNEVSLGIIYFEKPKVGWVNKPIVPTKWRAIDAKVEGVYHYKKGSITPTQLVKWAQELVEQHLQQVGEDINEKQDPND